MNYFTKIKKILIIKPFQDNLFNTMNLRHFALVFLLLFTETTYRSRILLSAKAFFFLPWDFGNTHDVLRLLPHHITNLWQASSGVIPGCIRVLENTVLYFPVGLSVSKFAIHLHITTGKPSVNAALMVWSDTKWRRLGCTRCCCASWGGLCL